MKTLVRNALASLSCVAVLAGCASRGAGDDWTTLLSGTEGLENFDRVGEANWQQVDGAVQATQGGKDPAYLVTRKSYKDFVLHVEFWASDDANSGIFFRCQEPRRINDENCYEANIFDQRPDPTYGTGAIVKVAPVAAPMPKAGGKWNSYEITAKGPRLGIVLNGAKTVEITDPKFTGGPIALQWGRGTIKFRKVSIRSL